MNDSNDYRPPQAPLEAPSTFDAAAAGLRTGMLFGAFQLIFYFWNGPAGFASFTPSFWVEAVAPAIAMVLLGRWVGAAHDQDWSEWAVATALFALLVAGINMASQVAFTHGGLTPNMGGRFWIAALGTFGVYFFQLLLMGFFIRAELSARLGKNTDAGRDARNRAPVDAGTGDWMTLDKPKFETYLRSEPPRTVRRWDVVFAELKTDFRSPRSALSPVLAVVFFALGLFMGDWFLRILGFLLLGFYVRKVWSSVRMARLGRLRFGIVKELTERSSKVRSIFLTTAQFEEGDSIKVLVDECLIRSLPLPREEIEVAVICMPKATLAWAISARLPRSATEQGG